MRSASSPALPSWVVEFRRREQEEYAAATELERDLLLSALDLLIARVDVLRSGSTGPVHLLDPDVSHLCPGARWQGVVNRFVWGRVMAVEDTWDTMPRYRGWLLSAWDFEGNASDKVTLVTHGAGSEEAVLLREGFPSGALTVFVPPVHLAPAAFEVYQTLRSDGLGTEEASSSALLLAPDGTHAAASVLAPGA